MPPHRLTTGGTTVENEIISGTIVGPEVSRRGRHDLQKQPALLRLATTALVVSLVACSSTNNATSELDPEGEPVTELAGGGKVDAAAADSFASELPPLQPGTPLPYDTVGETVTRASMITPAMISRGRELFHGRGEGASSCSTCHGVNGGGAATGPELRTGNFRNITGKYHSIIEVVTVGVAEPKQFVGMIMPPMGGVQMSDEDIRAVSAYVYTLAPEERRQVD